MTNLHGWALVRLAYTLVYFVLAAGTMWWFKAQLEPVVTRTFFVVDGERWAAKQTVYRYVTNPRLYFWEYVAIGLFLVLAIPLLLLWYIT
jgi:hypothetical protein